MKKKILIGVLVVALAAAGYLIAASHYLVYDYFRLYVPELDPNEGVGIWESEVGVLGNPGGANSRFLTFLNGKDADRTFYITLQSPNPDKLPLGYEPLPLEYYDWFTLPDEGIPVKAGGYCRAKITVEVPCDTDYLDKNAVVKVQGVGFDPSGYAQLGAASIWYIVVTATEE